MLSITDNTALMTPLTLLGDELQHDAIFYNCLVAVQMQVQSMAIEGITEESIVVRKLPLDRKLVKPSEVDSILNGVALPAILITPTTESMLPQAGLLGLDDVTYGVLATIIFADNQEPTNVAGLADALWVRERIARRFRQQPRLPGVPSIINGSVEPREVVNPQAWGNNLLVQALLLKFISREPMLVGV